MQRGDRVCIPRDVSLKEEGDDGEITVENMDPAVLRKIASRL
jgi:hypothetical protein